MVLQKLRILVVFQVPNEPHTLPTKNYLQFTDWEDEKDVISALKNLGHDVSLLGLKSEITELIQEISKVKPDLVFNLCETFLDERKHEANIAGICELVGIPYTGASPFALHLCQDKAIQKKILSYDKQIRTPHFISISKEEKKINLDSITYPAIVKPLNLEASEGICQKSYVTNKSACLDRILFIQKKLKSDIIIEEYVGGSDFYLGIIGNKQKDLLIGKPVKLIFEKYPSSKNTIATYRTKWDNDYRRKWGIKTVVMRQAFLTQKLQKTCQNIYKKLKLSGYARFDMRVNKDNECFFLEANPNPSISKSDDFSKSVKACGMNYQEIIKKIIFSSF